MKIVILPGLDGTGALVSEVERRLVSAHSVIRFRYPSHLYSYDDLQEWVSAKLPSDDFILVAESFSGPLAIMIAEQDPLGLRGIVLVASFARSPRRLPVFLTYALEVLPIKSRLFIRLAQPFLMGRWSTNAFTTKFINALEPIPRLTITRRLREVLNVNVVKTLNKLSLPTVYLVATHDRLVPSRVSKDFGSSGSRVIALNGPHFLLQANSSASAEHISGFANQLEGI